jgi:hypothetical protein
VEQASSLLTGKMPVPPINSTGKMLVPRINQASNLLTGKMPVPPINSTGKMSVPRINSVKMMS